MAKRKANGKAASPDAEAPAFPTAGFRIGEYVIETMLGHGSMSTVFLARDGTGHEVALKVFQEGPNTSATMLERFRREVEASKQLRHHPNIMTVYGAGVEPPFHFIAMQRIDANLTLELLIENEHLSIERVLKLIIKIARALHFAHERNIMHRDVKPSNIMINRFDEPLLADFGVAALLEWPKFTVAGALTGTPLYMSPEQARGETVGTTSDLYSLGVVLFEALTGVLPYKTTHFSAVQDTLRAVQNEPVRRPRQFREDLSPELEAVVMKLLSRNLEERYADGNAAADDLQRVLDDEPVRARIYSRWSRLRRRARRHGRALAALGSLLLVILSILLYFLTAVRDVQFQRLIGLARLQNSQIKVERLTREAADLQPAGRLAQEIRRARRDMGRMDWESAMAQLENVLRLSERDGDTRSAAMANLELARCSTMLEQVPQARDIYGRVLTNPDASPSIVGLAQLESALLAILQDRDGELEAILSTRAIPRTQPIADGLLLIRGDLSPEQTVARIHRLPAYLQNDTYLAAAVVAHAARDDDSAQEYLTNAITASRPATEWPAPFAKMLNARWFQ